MPIDQRQLPVYEIKAGLFKGLSHPLRIRILEILADGQPHSVAELQEKIGLEASHLSQHLAVIRRYQLVRAERRRSNVFYELAHSQVAELLRIARELLAVIQQEQLAATHRVAELPEV